MTIKIDYKTIMDTLKGMHDDAHGLREAISQCLNAQHFDTEDVDYILDTIGDQETRVKTLKEELRWLRKHRTPKSNRVEVMFYGDAKKKLEDKLAQLKNKEELK